MLDKIDLKASDTDIEEALINDENLGDVDEIEDVFANLVIDEDLVDDIALFDDLDLFDDDLI